MMAVTYTLLRLFLLLITSSTFSKASDPCLSYVELDDPYRSTGYVAIEGVDPMICDINLKPGWYRFVNQVGGEMPETMVDSFHCGTHAPIWMKGKHPSIADGIVSRTACVNFNGILNGCLPIGIKVKKCPGLNAFYVYRLVAPYGCQMAYCAGTKEPCPRGQSGLVPECKVLERKEFLYADLPVPKVTYVDDAQEKVTLKCDFDVPTGSTVSFEIQWFINGVGKKSKPCNDPDQGSCAHLNFGSGYTLGDQIRCDIKARYNTHPENKWTRTKASNLFFAGIEVHPTHLDAVECNASPTNRIKLRPTLPVRGTDIALRFGTYSHANSLLLNTCEMTLTKGEESKEIDISVQAVCDNTDQSFSPAAFTFTVMTTHKFWGAYESPPVTIRKIENPVGICKATGDPHYTTFDGKYYDFYRPGDFVLYRNKERSFEVHTRLWYCGGSVTCNCGVAVREKQDVIVLSICTQDLISRYGMPMKINIASKRRLTKGTKILARHHGGSSEYEIRLPSGSLVKIQRWSVGNNVELQAPRSDKTKTEGMCGNFDDNPSNDFDFGGDKKGYADEDAFGESWRVDTSESLFNTVPSCEDDGCDDSELQMDRCKCTKEDGSMSIECNLNIMEFKGIGREGFKDETDRFENANRGKRRLAYNDDVMYLYDDYEPKGDAYLKRKRRAVDAKMSFENATEYCTKTILNTAAAQICLETSGVDASSAIKSCAADLQLTGDPSWVEAAFESLKANCEFQAVRNFSAYDKDEKGNFVPPIKIAQNLCPNDCSFNGNCTNGTCICNAGYVAGDCSMRFNEIPRLFRILDKGLCDIRSRPCMKTIVFGEYFLNSENLTCHVKEYSVKPSKWIPSNETKTFIGRKTDLFAIECHLPKPPFNIGNFDEEGIPAAGYVITVSNDKVHESQQSVKLITFDSVCQECDASRGCALKRGSCLIRGHCFKEYDQNPKDWCQQCNTSVSQSNWTRRMINFPPRITSPSQRFAILGEELQLQLEGEEPDGRPFVISLLAGSPPKAKLNEQGVLFWKPQSATKRKFYFEAVDECNASSRFEMTIEILTCPCTNEGMCRPDPNHPRGSGIYSCECQPGYEGDRCENDINDCQANPCVHGTCIDAINNYTCRCDPGFTGYNCDEDVDECQSSPCIHGTCQDMVNAFRCTCQSGFTGPRCEMNIDDCPSSGCGNGTCRDLVQSYNCQCNVGFTGRHCEIIMQKCNDDSCFPGVRCIQKRNTISCDPCPMGFTGDGKNCEDIDYCIKANCKNGALCVDGLTSYRCTCAVGFTGEHCENDINDCVQHNCSNGGSCVDGVNNYTCLCAPGFTGYRCELDIDECANHTCLNEGTCIDGINSYSCNCGEEFTGDRCETATCKLPQFNAKHIMLLKGRKNRYISGESIILGCTRGYKTIGNNFLECTDEGNWTATTFHCEKTCLPPWTEFKKRCYLAISTSYTWTSAYRDCRKLNSTMTTISSKEENVFTAKLAQAYFKRKNLLQVQMWLGLWKKNTNAKFQWADGTSFAGFSNWSPGEPNNDKGRELCTEMLVSGTYNVMRWNDVKCNTASYTAITVCEKPLREGE